MATNPNTVPTHKIGGEIYIRVSAQLGHLEKYRVESVLWDETTNQWAYVVDNRRASQPTPSTNALGFGPRAGESRVGFRESEITDLCGALALARAFHTSKLASIADLEGTHGCDTTGTG